ncbi:MAG: 4Fe-4S dicluster domain-containing protein, partial [Acetobacteraceae bacterium]|nr:4Fe-4S dicluster domain-containing protein [Acetobacteraceae bacterium]
MAAKRTVLVCSCDDTIRPDAATIARGCPGTQETTAHQLCRAEIERFRAAVATGAPLTVGCTQEAPLFTEEGGNAEIAFANIRETAGWSRDGGSAAPKMAALLAAAAEPMPPTPLVSLESDGVILIYGRDERAIEAATLLKDKLDVTVLLTRPAEVVPPRVTEFPIVKGTIRSAKGHLGAFELTVDDYAFPAASSRGALAFGPTRDGAVSRCDIVLDLSGGPALLPAADLRDGYLRADPGEASAMLRAVLRAGDLTGTFDKPRYIAFTDDLCAHARSKIVGCRRCLDLCPTSAITPAGNHVAIDPNVCAGCGSCASACPTGAASYALPPVDALTRRLRTLLVAFQAAGGAHPVLLIHDEEHGAALIDALARHGDGLPAHVLPLAVNAVTQVGLELVAAAFAYGAQAMRFLLRAKPRHDVTALTGMLALAEPILAGLGFGEQRVATIETDDPFALGDILWSSPPHQAATRVASFEPRGEKRDLLRLALRELHQVAPAPVDVVALPAGAPFGAVEIDVAGCTLCL